MDSLGWPPVAVLGQDGRAPFVLVCEHASRFVPPEMAGLGASEEALSSHVAYDIGAFDMARRLSARLAAPLVAGQISRLVYDCNRPLDAPDAIPEQSEVFDIPGNVGLSEEERRRRFNCIHTPFHDAVGAVLDRQIARCAAPVTLVTLHSFTPVYRGKRRLLDVGYLFHKEGALANEAMAIDVARGVVRAEVNAPYSASDGVTYSLRKHGEARGLHSVMVEVRNDLIDRAETARDMADHLAETLTRAVAQVQQTVRA